MTHVQGLLPLDRRDDLHQGAGTLRHIAVNPHAPDGGT